MQTEPSKPRHSATAMGWPTTMRFSRRLGEALRGPEYAAAFEGASGPTPVHIEVRTARLQRTPRLIALLLGGDLNQH